MIFRTIESDVEGANAQLSIFGKSFAQIRRDLNNNQGLGVSVFGGTKLTQADISAITKFNEARKQGVPIGIAWRENMAQCTAYAKQETTQYLRKKKSLEELVTSQEAATASSIGLQAATIALNMALTVGVSLAIQGVIKGIDYLIHRNEKLIESAKEVSDTYREQSKTLKDNIKSLQDQKDEFDRLSKGVDDYGNNISLSTDEYSRYKDVVAEIFGYSPELIAGYDEEGNAIAKKNGLIEQSIALMKEEQKQRLREATTKDNTSTLYKGTKAEYDNAQKARNNLSLYDNVVSSGFVNSYGNNPSSGGHLTMQHLQAIISSITGEVYDATTMSWDDYLTRHKDIITKNYDDIREEMSKPLLTGNGTIFGLGEDDLNTFMGWLKDTYNSIKDLEDASHGFDDQFMLFAQRADNYDKLTDAQKNFVNEYIKATGSIIDADGEVLSNAEIYAKANAFERFAEELATSPEFKEAREQINSLFSLDKNEYSAAGYEARIDEILKYLVENIDGFNEDDANKIKIDLGFEFMADGSTRVDTLVEQVQGILQDKLQDGFKVTKLSIEDLQLGAKVALDIEETQKDIEEELTNLEEGGSVNLLVRPVIDTSELNKHGWNESEGEKATVFSSTFSNEDGTIAINFTPIMADPETGEYLGTLTPDELQDYAESVIAGTIDDYLTLQIGAKFEGEEAIEEAEQTAEKIHELHQQYFVDNTITFDELCDRIRELKRETEDAVSLDKFNDSIDKIQSAYDTLTKARDEYNKNGAYSLDTVQALLALEPQYLAMLVNENG